MMPMMAITTSSSMSVKPRAVETRHFEESQATRGLLQQPKDDRISLRPGTSRPQAPEGCWLAKAGWLCFRGRQVRLTEVDIESQLQ